MMMRDVARVCTGSRTIAIVALTLTLAFGTAFAHIKNEASQFPDIEYANARFDIVVLVGAGVIPETPVFEPDRPLSKREVATWAALVRGLGRGGETPDTDALAAAAIDNGIVDSLQGDATYSDLNRLFFDEHLALEDGEKIPSKGEAASFIADKLSTDAGRALLARRGIRAGTTGEITSVETKEGHHGGSAYFVTVGETTLQMHEHGRVANGPTDLLQWGGRNVRRTFVSGEGENAIWIYLEAQPLQEAAPEATTGTANEAQVEVTETDRSLLYWLIAAVIALGLVLFVRRRRSG